ISTGHTADDQAETVLHRFLRGSAVAGLSGIWPARRYRGVTIVRPLLAVRRAAVLEFLTARDLSAQTDSPNAGMRVTRNGIRQRLLPLLVREYNPRLVEQLCRLAELAAATRKLERRRARLLLRRVELPRAGSLVVLDAERIGRAKRGLVRDLLRVIWQREGW